MNKVNKGLIGIVVILSVLVLGLGSYVIYDKVLKEDNINNIQNESSNNLNEDIVLLSEQEALDIVKEKTKKYFEYYHNLGPYCGKIDGDDYISFGSYETQDFRDYNASITYKNIKEMKEYYASFMIEDLFPSYIENGVSYIEQDGKLYCQLSHKGCGDMYNEDASYYVIDNIAEDTIVSKVILASDTCGDVQNIREGKVTLVKDSLDNWLVSQYDVYISDLD